MKPIIKLFLKILLFTGIPFGLINVLFVKDFTSGFSFSDFIYPTLFFGIFMSLIFASLHLYSLKELGIHKITSSNMSVSQTKNIRTSINLSELIEKIKQDKFFINPKISEKDATVLIKTGFSIKSWGEVISIKQMSHDNGVFEYQISSKPKLITTLVDFGKSHENIIRIEKIMNKKQMK